MATTGPIGATSVATLVPPPLPREPPRQLQAPLIPWLRPGAIFVALNSVARLSGVIAKESPRPRGLRRCRWRRPCLPRARASAMNVGRAASRRSAARSRQAARSVARASPTSASLASRSDRHGPSHIRTVDFDHPADDVVARGRIS
jgi:hypothetical protein